MHAPRISILILVIFSCCLSGCLGDPAPYPYRPPADLRQDAQQLSQRLDTFIREWLAGNNDGILPEDLLPDGYDRRRNQNFRLVDPDTVDPESLWGKRLAAPVDRNALRHSLPDPNATYLVLGTPYAPFGSSLVIEGEFPRCRFFNIQVTPPFDGASYYYNRELGVGEVSIVDADIDPLPGHTNPFRLGADRMAQNRSYRVRYDLQLGDPVALNPAGAHGQPYRSNEQRRSGAMITAEGPWGADASYGNGIAHGRGELNLGMVWIRYYAMDHGIDGWGGVAPPKAWFELASGERYLIVSDFSGFQDIADKSVPATVTPPQHPPASAGPDRGWGKSFGIMHNIVQGLADTGVFGLDEQYGNDFEMGLAGRGENAVGAGHNEAHATVCVHTTYMGRNILLGPEDPWRPGTGGKVAVLTGRMPTFPDTRNGTATMPGGDLRYWSLVGYEINFIQQLQTETVMPAMHVVMDDEVILDAERRYTIVYSRAADRPANATAANGVTWVDWGPNAELSVLFRWMSVAGPWSTTPNPHDYPDQLTWANSSWSGSAYDPNLLGNHHQGHLGEHLPKVHYMSRADFESFGTRPKSREIPTWSIRTGNGSLHAANNPVAVAVGLRVHPAEITSNQDLTNTDTLNFRSPVIRTNVDTSAKPRDDHYALLFDGYIEVAFADMYRFHLHARGAVQLSINGQTICMDNNFDNSRTCVADVGLDAGKHRITLLLMSRDGADELDLQLSHSLQYQAGPIPFWSWSHTNGNRSIRLHQPGVPVIHLDSGSIADGLNRFRFDGLSDQEDHVFQLLPPGVN